MPVSTASTPAQLPFSAHFKRCEPAEENPHHGNLKSNNISKKSKLETFAQLRKGSQSCKCFLTPQCICPEMDGREKFSSIFPNDFCEIRRQSLYPTPDMSNTRKATISTEKVLITWRLPAYLVCVTTPPPSQVSICGLHRLTPMLSPFFCTMYVCTSAHIHMFPSGIIYSPQKSFCSSVLLFIYY